MYLFLVSSEYFSGQFRYKGKRYKVAIRQPTYPLLNNQKHLVKVKFAKGKEDSAFLRQWNYRPEYYQGDTAVLGSKVFLIKNIAHLYSQITLQPLQIAAWDVKPNRIDTESIGAQSQKWVGKPFPSFSLQQGMEVLTVEKLKGKVFFVNFWFAAWPPCIAEFEALSQMYEKLDGKDNFRFISLTFESPETIEKVKQKYGLRFPIYSINQQECEKLNVGKGYPTNIIVDKNGIIQHITTGGETEKEAAKNFIEDVIYTKILQEL